MLPMFPQSGLAITNDILQDNDQEPAQRMEGRHADGPREPLRDAATVDPLAPSSLAFARDDAAPVAAFPGLAFAVDRDQGSRLEHPRPQCEDTLLEEDGRRRRVALDGFVPDGGLQVDIRSDPLARSRTISHQPSCDSLRNFSASADVPHSHAPLGASQAVSDADHGSLSEGLYVQHGNASQYTVLTDMAETAWSVDDTRYGADVLDSITIHDSYAPQTQLRHALSERASADKSTLPMFNRQESIESGLDMQGIDWSRYGASRCQTLRDRALHQTSSHSNQMNIDCPPVGLNYQAERHYRFHYFNGTVRPKFAHHQLRHVLASVGREVYYTTSSKVMRASLACPSVESTVLDLSRSTMTSTPIRVTCLAATDSSIIIAGGFDGEYALRNLDSPASHSEGYVTHDRNGLVTHVHTFSHRRSGLPQAAFCANDQRLRLMDLATETFTKTLSYDSSLNSAVTASDGRLRALVGDSPDALITDAESGETLASLRSHTDHIFSCAWSPDDKLLATGGQDGKIALWDSRNWAQPLAELPNVLSCSRSLHFTADSSTLVSAENEDVVSVFDSRSLAQPDGRQDIRFFGTIAGVALVDGGDEIVVANGDRSVGGLLSFRRTYGSGEFRGWGGSLEPVERCRRRTARRKGARIGAAVVEEFGV